MISATDFLRSTSEHAKSGGFVAFIVDLGGVQNIDDPTVERALLDHLRQAAGEVTDQVARLGRYEIACLCSDQEARALSDSVDELNDVVRDLGLGAIRADRYQLPRDGRALVERVRAIAGSLEAARVAGMRRERRNDLAQLLKTEQMLRQVDISSLVHHQAIYDFVRPRSPVTVARELTVSIARLSEMLGIPVDRNPWLFDRVTAMLDRRMLSHLIRDRSRHAEPFAVNLRVSTVLGTGFTDLISRLAAQQHDTLIVELPQADREADGRAFDAAVEELERIGVHSAFHAGGWEDMRSLLDSEDARILGEIDFLKVRWDSTDLDLTAAETGTLKALVERVGAHRLVLERAETEAAIEFGQRIGIRLMQGFGVTGHIRGRQEKEHDRAANRLRKAARQKTPAPTEAGDNRGVLRKMFKL